MKKLSLDVDALRVESFQTAPAEPVRGTVAGHLATFGPPCATAARGSTCAATCSSGDTVCHTEVC
jgi:hypothetical protein